MTFDNIKNTELSDLVGIHKILTILVQLIIGQGELYRMNGQAILYLLLIVLASPALRLVVRCF
jgi:hypothetical protein